MTIYQTQPNTDLISSAELDECQQAVQCLAAYENGITARRHNRPPSDCPIALSEVASSWWYRGWWAAHRGVALTICIATLENIEGLLQRHGALTPDIERFYDEAVTTAMTAAGNYT